MALPASIDPSTPAGADSPSQGDDQFRALKQYLVDVLGFPSAVNVTAGAFTMTTGGVVTALRSPFGVPSVVLGGPSSFLQIGSQYSQMDFLAVGTNIVASITPTGLYFQPGRSFIEVSSGYLAAGTGGATSIFLYTQGQNNPRLTVTGAGNVGVGTTVPTAQFHLAGQGFMGTQMVFGGQSRYDLHASGRLVIPVGSGFYAT